jgi:MFS transporter, DHA1 family, multidrug resistance protein
MLLVGSFLNGTALPMVVGIAGCAAVALALAQTTLRSTEAVPPVEAAAD